MIEISATDYAPMDSFPRRWRWTDERYRIFDAEELSRIRPLRVEKAWEICKRSSEFVSKETDLLSPELFEARKEIDTNSGSDVSAWLADRQPISNLEIVVSWDQECAVVTDWELFVRYWDDFCYPSSDDVMVFPVHESWVLDYRHYE